MLQPLAFLSSLAGVGLALSALMVEGSGVDGTPGAVLAVIGASATVIGLLLLTTARLSRGARIALGVLSVLAAGLTALAAWFLMQDALALVMAIACAAVLAVAANPRPLRRI